MNKLVFCDQQKETYIKVCESEAKALREYRAANILKKFVRVPTINMIDSRTVLVSKAKGKTTSSENEILNERIIDYFKRVKSSNGIVSNEWSIEGDIFKLEQIFTENSKIMNALEVLREKLDEQTLFPVHGDLQIQNLFLTKNSLALIDFEHFLYAPLELDLCNSLFFEDENCLQVEKLLPLLCQQNIFSKENVYYMLIFYSLKQLAYERSAEETNRRLAAGINRLNKILKTNFKSLNLIVNTKNNIKYLSECSSQFYFG